MIERGRGSLLDADTEALVNTVNCVGVMGKGVALLIKRAYPENYTRYQEACTAGQVVPGRMLVFDTGLSSNPRYIINFPTKRHWKGKSKLSDIRAGLPALVAEIRKRGIKSIAVPALGCGNGGLDWAVVRPLIVEAFAELPDVHVELFDPQESAPGGLIGESDPSLTRAQAALIKLLDAYLSAGYTLARPDLHRLIYLLWKEGEPLGVQFTKHGHPRKSAPIERLYSSLADRFIAEYGDMRETEIRLLPGAIELANKILRQYPDTVRRVNRVAELIEGFQSQFGLKILTDVYLASQRAPLFTIDPGEILVQFQEMGEYKSDMFKPEYLVKAWRRLCEQRWILAPARSHQSLAFAGLATRE